MSVSGVAGWQRRAGRAALGCALGLGALLGLAVARSGVAAASGKPVPAAAHARAAVPKGVKLVEPVGARHTAPLGAGHRPGRTITVRAARRSLPR